MARKFTRYGRAWEVGTTDINIELWCFKYAWPEEKGGLGRYGHAVNCINLLWNYRDSPTPVIWNPWLEYGLKHACENDVCIMGGGSSCGKSMIMALLALLFYLADPTNTMCLITSTTIEGAKKRIFKDVKRFWRSEFPGKLVDGKGQIKGLNDEGKIDDSRGIHIIPCANIGDPRSRFIGIKSKNMHVFYDELSELPIELVEVWRTNLRTNAVDTPPTLIAASNPKGRMDAFGLLATPKRGWKSVDLMEDELWETEDGIYIRFDNLKNPRIVCGREDWSFFTPKQVIDDAITRYGENSPQVLRFYKATFSDDIEEGCLMSEAEIINADADTRPLWGPEPVTRIAGLDPAYTNGGDQVCLKTAIMGYDIDHHFCVCIDKTFFIKSTATKEENKERNFDVAKQVAEILETEKIPPANLAVDVTGGLAFAEILASFIGAKFCSVSFSGKASASPMSANIPERGCDLYANKVSELWGAIKLALASRQLYGLDPETISELTTRHYETRGKLICVERKEKMKKRLARSPDSADAVALVIHMMVRLNAREFGKINQRKVRQAQVDVTQHRRDANGNRIISESEIASYLKDSRDFVIVHEPQRTWRDDVAEYQKLLYQR